MGALWSGDYGKETRASKVVSSSSSTGYQILANFRHLFVVNALICEKTKYKLKRPTMAGLKKN